MLIITFKYDSSFSLNTIVFQNCIKVWQVFCCVIREDHRLSAIFKIINNGSLFIFGNICGRRIDEQAICIIRNTSLCKKIQRLNIHICLLDVFFDSRIHLLLTMSLKCIKDREIFGCYISDRTCDLTFTIETGGLITVGLIVHCALINIVVINDFVSVAAYNDQTVCRKIITCIFRYKFRIYYRILLLYFNMLGFILIFFK